MHRITARTGLVVLVVLLAIQGVPASDPAAASEPGKDAEGSADAAEERSMHLGVVSSVRSAQASSTETAAPTPEAAAGLELSRLHRSVRPLDLSQFLLPAEVQVSAEIPRGVLPKNPRQGREPLVVGEDWWPRSSYVWQTPEAPPLPPLLFGAGPAELRCDR